MESSAIIDEDDAQGIVFFSENQFDLDHQSEISAWLQQVVASEGQSLHTVNFVFMSDEQLLSLNIEYLDHDTYTDVIGFPYSEDPVWGDIYISTDRIAENAMGYGVSSMAELCRVLVHGLLHFLGYRDKTEAEKKKMKAKENYYLKKLNLSL